MGARYRAAWSGTCRCRCTASGRCTADADASIQITCLQRFTAFRKREKVGGDRGGRPNGWLIAKMGSRPDRRFPLGAWSCAPPSCCGPMDVCDRRASDVHSAFPPLGHWRPREVAAYAWRDQMGLPHLQTPTCTIHNKMALREAAVSG